MNPGEPSAYENAQPFPVRAGPRVWAPAETVESSEMTVQAETIELFGVTIHNVTRDDVFELIEERICRGTPGYILTPNVDHVCRFQKDGDFRQAYRECFLSLADGVPLLWASRLLGRPLREKISGSDLVVWLPEFLAARERSLFLLGAAEGVADEAAAVLTARHPGLRIAGTYSPPLGFEKDPASNAETLERVREAQPDVCFVALGSPKQEYWLQRHSAASETPVMLGIGAGLDFIAGRSRRAPLLMQKAGLEWFWRLVHEPRRLARRYLIDDSLFLSLLWQEFWTNRTR